MAESPSNPVTMSSGLPTTVLPEPPAELVRALDDAAAEHDPERRRQMVSAVVAAAPRSLEAWAALGDANDEVIARYAAYRVGYHRGLDALRANGWRGSGYVRWSAPSNRAFLTCLVGLGTMAGRIGENDEAERCAVFLSQLDPQQWPSPPAF